jgi:hypothetical protein
MCSFEPTSEISTSVREEDSLANALLVAGLEGMMVETPAGRAARDAEPGGSWGVAPYLLDSLEGMGVSRTTLAVIEISSISSSIIVSSRTRESSIAGAEAAGAC